MGNEKRDPKDLKQAYRVSYLLAGYIKKTLTAAEQKELDQWIEQSDHNRQMFLELTGRNNVEEAMKFFLKPDVEQQLQKSKENIEFKQPEGVLRLMPFLLIAASVVTIVLVIIFFRSVPTRPEKPELVEIEQQEISPGSGHAILTLGDGKQIVLRNNGSDSIINDQLSIKSNALVYNGSGTPHYNTLSVPAGGTYKLKLGDGTLIYLNSLSSIRYPTSFDTGTRKVFMTGEAFFEVIHDKKKPFIVEAGRFRVEDLGTSFNVNAYENEPAVSATLVEGKIKVSVGNRAMEMQAKPGEQVRFSGENFVIKKDIDVNEVIAWKNGEFRFVNTSLQEIMRYVERWYDAKVVYQDTVNVHLNATIQRNVPVSRLLHLLSRTEDVHFKIEGKRIIVMK